MAATADEGIKIPSLHQVGIVVKNVDKAVQNCWNLLGIGPWTIITMPCTELSNRIYRGKPGYFEVKVGLCQVGSIELEFMETIDGRTAYDDFEQKHGEGANHLQYLADSIDEIDNHVKIMGRKGFSFIMGGRLGTDGAFAYFDTVGDLGTVWEAVKMPSKFTAPTMTFPEKESESSSAKIKVQAITQVGMVVKDLQKSVRKYWEILGIGPWRVIDCSPPILHDTTYNSKPTEYTTRAAIAKVGENLDLELIQPVSGDSPYLDFLCRHGEGIHHLAFSTEDVEEVSNIMRNEGFPVITEGGFSDGMYAYYDTRVPLKIIWQAFRPPKTSPPMTSYP